MNINTNCADKAKLMRLIQQYSFAVTEAVLYLDTHPHCKKALNYYNKYTALREEAVSMYENKYGPLTMYGAEGENTWRWATDPWPWEN